VPAFQFANDVLDLFYPRICASCDHGKPVKGQIFCVECLVELPQTRFHLVRDNPFEQHFWGRVDIVAGAAMYFFIPGGRTQTLLHNIKYRRLSHIAEVIGDQYGSQMAQSDWFSNIDVVIPVPLHWRRIRQRGFNQSEVFARGLAKPLDADLDVKSLVRHTQTATQTRKSREERVLNMKDAFSLTAPDNLAYRQILLVDDVLTTGATLEACANVLLEAPGVSISIATIACGRI